MKTVSIAVVILLLNSSVAIAASTVTVVTPSNILSQPLTLRVTHESYDDGTVRFEVLVSSGKSEVSPSRDGRFVVWQEDIKAQPGPIRGAPTRPPMIAACNVKEDNQNGTLVYQVIVNRDLLRRVTFTFRNYESHGMPAFDAYEVILGRFMRDRD